MRSCRDRALDRVDGRHAPDQQRDRHVREHDDVAERQQRQALAELEALAARRCGACGWRPRVPASSADARRPWGRGGRAVGSRPRGASSDPADRSRGSVTDRLLAPSRARRGSQSGGAAGLGEIVQPMTSSARRDVVHHVEHRLLDHGAQAAGAGAALRSPARAMASSASSVKSSFTPSISKNFWYCLVIAFFGSVRISTSESSSSESSDADHRQPARPARGSGRSGAGPRARPAPGARRRCGPSCS